MESITGISSVDSQIAVIIRYGDVGLRSSMEAFKICMWNWIDAVRDNNDNLLASAINGMKTAFVKLVRNKSFNGYSVRFISDLKLLLKSMQEETERRKGAFDIAHSMSKLDVEDKPKKKTVAPAASAVKAKAKKETITTTDSGDVEKYKYNGHLYTVHVGPRGGRFINCDGKKKRI
jgi:hypothetical protein